MSSEPLQDPLDVLSPEVVKSLGPIRGIDTRIGQTIHKHVFEVCLKETYFRTIQWFKGKRHISHYHRKKHLFKLRQEIIHHCLANDLDPKAHLIEGSLGNFIVMPEIESNIYFGMLANRLYITPANGVRNFLDFHYTNWTMLNEQAPQPFGYFIKNLSFLVLLNLERNMPDINQSVINELRQWINVKFDEMDSKELSEYHRFLSSPKKLEQLGFENGTELSQTDKNDNSLLKRDQGKLPKPRDPGISRVVDHGSTEVIIKHYFNLLKQQNPSFEQGQPFVSSSKVNYMLSEYFGIDDAGLGSEINDRGYSIARKEMCFFIHEFYTHLQVRTTRASLRKKQLVDMCIKEFPDLFKGKDRNIYKNWGREASNGQHELLNWRNNEVIKTQVGYYK